MSMFRALAGSMICTMILAGSALAGPHSDAPASAPGATPLDMRGPMQPEDGPAPDTERTWYGWQIFLADAAVTGGLMFALYTVDRTSTGTRHREKFLWSAGLLYAGAAPFVHGLHGQGRTGALSMAMRLSLPTLGGVLGYYSVGDCIDCHPADEALAAISGMLSGIAVASLIDITLLSHKRRPVERRQEHGWAPTLGVTGSAFSAGIVGWF